MIFLSIFLNQVFIFDTRRPADYLQSTNLKSLEVLLLFSEPSALLSTPKTTDK